LFEQCNGFWLYAPPGAPAQQPPMRHISSSAERRALHGAMYPLPFLPRTRTWPLECRYYTTTAIAGLGPEYGDFPIFYLVGEYDAENASYCAAVLRFRPDSLLVVQCREHCLLVGISLP
jgi:hypothetical protein